MAASQNNLTLVINQQDTNGVSILNRTIGAVTFAGIVGQYTDGVLLTGAQAFTLPTANIHQFVFQNTHSSAVVTLNGTKQGGTGAILGLVGPSGVFVYWGQTSGSTEGYTALTGTSTVSGSTYHMFLGG